MSVENVPSELRDVARTLLSELSVACGDGGCRLDWLREYEVLELRAPGLVANADLEIYLPRPLLEDVANLDLASRKQLLGGLRGIPARAIGGAGRFWLLREQGEAHALRQRPFP